VSSLRWNGCPVCVEYAGKPLAGLRLALMHHPLTDLADGAQCRRRLAGHVDLVLRGHLHETEVHTWADPDRQIRQLAAGCLYEGHRADQYPNACVLVTLQLNALGRPERIDLRFRTWSPNGHWYDDGGLYRESRNGRLTWSLETPRSTDNSHNPCDPWTPVTPPRFVGRSALMQAFETAIQEGHGISVVGDWRIGKSSLLLTWYRQAEAARRTVRMLSGEGPEGASPDALVRAITGLPVAGDVEAVANILKGWAASASAPGLPPIVIVDEADSMMSRFPYRFWERLRDMLGLICLVLASRREIDLIYQDLKESSPFNNRLKLRRLGVLEATDAKRLIATWGPHITPDDEDLILEWAGLHPYYLTLLGHHLVAARQRGEIIGEALDDFLAESDARLRELWKALDTRDRKALLAAQSGKAINPADRRHLRQRGLLDSDGKPFGRVLTEWLRDQAPEEDSN